MLKNEFCEDFNLDLTHIDWKEMQKNDAPTNVVFNDKDYPYYTVYIITHKITRETIELKENELSSDKAREWVKKMKAKII